MLDLRSLNLLKRLSIALRLAGGDIQGPTDQFQRFAVIVYDIYLRQFVFSARRWNDLVSSYICQLQQGGQFCTLILPKYVLKYVSLFMKNYCVISSKKHILTMRYVQA